MKGKRTNMSQQVWAHLLMISLSLQSCSQLPNSLPIPTKKVLIDKLPTVTEHQLNKKNITSTGHIISFLQEAGQLQAIVEENLPDGFGKTHILPVYITQGINVAQIRSWDKEAQKIFNHVELPKKGQPGYVWIGKRGLLGGSSNQKGKEKLITDDQQEEEGQIQEWVLQPDEDIDLQTDMLLMPVEIFEEDCVILFNKIDSFDTYRKHKSSIIVLVDWLHRIIFDLITKQIKNYAEGRHVQLLSRCEILSKYIKDILGAKYFDDFEEQDKQELINQFHLLLYEIAKLRLNMIDNSRGNIKLIQECVEGYKAAKKELGNTFGISRRLLPIDWRKELNELYEFECKNNPRIPLYFDPTASRTSFTHPRKISSRQVEYKQKKQRDQAQEIFSSMNLPNIEEIKITGFLHDVYSTNKFGGEILAFDKQYNDICNRSEKEPISQEEFIQLTEKFLELEQAAFRLRFSSGHSTGGLYNPTVNNLVDIYELMLSRIDIYIHVRKGICLLAKTKNFDHALIQLDALEVLYKSRKAPERFEYDQALDYALCGKYEKLFQLYEKEVKKKLEKKKRVEEKRKQKLQEGKTLLDTQSNSIIFKPAPIQTAIKTKQPLDITTTSTAIDMSQAAYLEQQEVFMKRKGDRIKRHQEAEEKRYSQKQLVKNYVPEGEAQADTSSISTELAIAAPSDDHAYLAENPLPIDFFLPNRAFKTVHQIFNNNWQISRNDIENLFNELGPTIHTATKSSHHIITIPAGIALVSQDEKIIGMVSDLSAIAGGHLSLPKWDKEVPFYMRSQIQNILELIGIKQGNYFKGSRDKYTQFVVSQSKIESTPDTSKNSSSGISKRRKRKSKSKLKAQSEVVERKD